MHYKNVIASFFLLVSFPLWGFSYQELKLNDYQEILPLIETGKIYANLQKVNDNLGIVTVIGKIDTNINEVWRLVQSDNKKIYPDILEEHILKQEGKKVIKKALLNFPWPLSDRWTIYEEKIDDKLFAKEWKEIGGDIKTNRGAIRLFNYKNNTTIMVYKLSFDPGLAFIPEWAIELGMKYKAPSIIERVRYCLKYCNEP
jgi:hypothetical protein